MSRRPGAGRGARTPSAQRGRAGPRGSPYPWLAGALAATLLLAGLALTWRPGQAGVPLLLGALASVPLPAWLLGLRRWTCLGQGWSRGAWVAAVLAGYVGIGLLYSAARLALTGSVGALTVPLLWPTLLVADAGCALGWWGCVFQ